jgi:hypothetical protein
MGSTGEPNIGVSLVKMRPPNCCLEKKSQDLYVLWTYKMDRGGRPGGLKRRPSKILKFSPDN